MLPAVAGAAPVTLPYRSYAWHYGMSYPSTWSRFAVQGADFAIAAPDRNGFLSVSVGPGRASARDGMMAINGAFSAFGRPLGGPSFRLFRVHGASGTFGYNTVTAPGKQQSRIYVLIISRKGLIYSILGVVPKGIAPSTAADSAMMMRILGSTVLFS
jgi:hypothetical protein